MCPGWKESGSSIFTKITLCFEGEPCPGEALPVWDSQAQTVTNDDEEGSSSRREIDKRSTSKRGIDLQDFFIPAREWVRGELLSSIVSEASLAMSSSQWVSYFFRFCCHQFETSTLNFMSLLKTTLALKFVQIQGSLEIDVTSSSWGSAPEI